MISEQNTHVYLKSLCADFKTHEEMSLHIYHDTEVITWQEYEG